jgi:phospholipid/cholesterol/gamma-HCH transport system substrate-binding protein
VRGLLAPLIKLVIFLVITIFFTYVLGATIANTSYGSTTTYKALFSNVQGLSSGDDVRVAGVRVGTVSGIKIVQHNLAQVSFSVVNERPLPKNVQVYLRYRNLVGQRYIDVQQGTGDDNALLTKGETIPLSQTHNALDLTALFNSFQPLFQGLDAPAINQLSDEIVQTLQGEGGSFDHLFRSLGDLTNSLADKDQVIGSVVDNLASFLTGVGQRDGELDNLIVQLQGFISGLAQDRTTISNAIDGVNNLATTTAGLLSEARAPLAKDISDLSALTANLNAGSATIQRALNLLPPTTAVLTRTGSYGSWFNFYLCSITADLTFPNGTVVPLNVHQPTNVARCNP